MSKFVLDASVVVRACQTTTGFDALGDAELVAPRLMWSEARASIRETLWRGEIDEADAIDTYRRLASCPVKPSDHTGLHEEA